MSEKNIVAEGSGASVELPDFPFPLRANAGRKTGISRRVLTPLQFEENEIYPNAPGRNQKSCCRVLICSITRYGAGK